MSLLLHEKQRLQVLRNGNKIGSSITILGCEAERVNRHHVSYESSSRQSGCSLFKQRDYLLLASIRFLSISFSQAHSAIREAPELWETGYRASYGARSRSVTALTEIILNCP